ncbi:MAG: putative addiction module antidote protein [Planctomycetaceae bacterium]|nr:putative addiction module antidote protein [Planctomycetaceae bacterium]
MKKRNAPATVSHDERVIARLKRDPEFAVEYLRAAIEEATDEDGRHVLLAAIRQVVAAQGIAKVARAAGLQRESLSRALSSQGNPRLDTLYAVLRALGLQLTVARAPLTA